MTNLFPTFRFGDVDLTVHPYAVAFGSDRGNAANIVERVKSALRTGSVTRVSDVENRTVTIPLLIEASDLGTLAEAEATLVLEASKPVNEFVFNPGDGFSPDSVYDTFQADLTQEYDDELEAQFFRRFVLTFEALPFPRSAAKVVTPAAGDASTVVVDDGSSTTGWTIANPAGAVLSVSSGAVTSTYDGAAVSGWNGTTLVRALSTPVDVTANKYLGIDWSASRPVLHVVRVNGQGVNLPEIRRDPMSGFTRSWYRVPGDVTSLTSFLVGSGHDAAAGSQTLKVDRVQVANVLPFGANTRQSMSVLMPDGSVATDGSVHLYHPTAGLGTALVFTKERRVAYQPPLSPWKTGGGTFSANSYDIAGGQTDISTTAVTYRLPSNILPDSDAIIIAKLYSNPAGTVKINYSVRSGIGSTPVGPADVGSVDVSLSSTGWTWVTLGKFRLPPTRVGEQGYVDVQIQRDASSSPSVYIDEAFMLSTEGQLTIVDCGGNGGGGTPATGTIANHLWIEAPSLENEAGAIWLGTDPTGADRWHASSDQIIAWGVHEFSPNGTDIFAANQGAPNASLEFEHYPRWQSNAAS